MKLFRRKKLARTFSVFAVLVFVTNILSPTLSYALTTGPHQPEYTSYEEPGASDMVNLLTGDFNLNMPLITVPVGSEGGFTVPLTYHAGIGPEQEASWVGLGWNINVGSITRSINGFPDDANKETQTVSVKDLTGRRGWHATFLETTMGWDSQIGHYGVLNLGTKIGYNESGISSVGLAGLTVSGGDASFDPVEFGMTVMEVVSAIATYGASTVKNVGLKIAQDIAIELAVDAVTKDFTPVAGAAGNWRYTKETDKDLFHTNYWIWLDDTRVEDMHGVLNLDKAPMTRSNHDDRNYLKVRSSINGGGETEIDRFQTAQGSSGLTVRGAASDINVNVGTSPYYEDHVTPTTLAYDNFLVRGPGISGSIKPYRLEVGSVAMPREMTDDHIRYNPVPFLNYGASKVPFVYEGTHANRYFHHVGTSGSAVSDPSFYFGVSSSFVADTPDFPGANPNQLRYNFVDAIFQNQRIRPDVSATKKIEQGHYIHWLTNAEIKNTSGKFSGTDYLDYFDQASRVAFRTNYEFGGRQSYHSTENTITNDEINLGDAAGQFAVNDKVDVNVLVYSGDPADPTFVRADYLKDLNVDQVTASTIILSLPDYTGQMVSVEVIAKKSTKPDHAIGGFVITDPSGMNYHFSIPVYDYDYKTESINKDDAGQVSTISRNAPFANTWLLTAITGPDFVDRGATNNAGNGVIDSNDWGYWIKFNYGKFTSNYKWRAPFGLINYTRDPEDKHNFYSEGLTEKYYLNSIESRSHIALFVKNNREDARDASSGQKSLRLSEIALVTRGVYNEMLSLGLPDCSGKIDVNYLATHVAGFAGDKMRAKSLKRIVFNQDYSLCLNTPNSWASGKLTLKSIAVLGRNNAKVFPDYKFQYSNSNPAYDVNKWDGWGMYNASGTAAGTTHKASNSGTGEEWCLKKVTTPDGSHINMTYERDTYASISGERMLGSSVSFNNQNVHLNYPMDVPVHRLLINHNNNFSVGEKVRVSGTVDYACSKGTGGISKEFSKDCIIDIVGNGYLYFREDYMGIGTCNGNMTDGDYIDLYMQGGAVHKLVPEKKGGNIRVASIQHVDPNGQSYKTQYLYNHTDGSSSGVVAQEPDYIKGMSYPFYDYLNYPVTNVLYGKVTVLSGRLAYEGDYDTKQVYEFETPDATQYQISSMKTKNKELMSEFLKEISGVTFRYYDYSTNIKHEISKRTSRIGKIRSMKVYDKAGNIPFEREYFYADIQVNRDAENYMGIYSEGTLMVETSSARSAVQLYRFHKAQRTTVLNYPYVLKKVVTKVDGFSSETEHTNRDLPTGMVLETEDTSPLGIKTRTTIIPAWKVYPDLASKATNPAGKNMLSQVAYSETERIDNNGADVGLISASASVWKNEWNNYRIVDANNSYADGSELDADNNGTVDATEALNKIWRKSDSYAWKGAYAKLNPDGSHQFSGADRFNFADLNANAYWQRIGSSERYSHNSLLLETKDMNGVYSSIKFGHGDQQVLASASNARFEEMAFSSAEDRLSATSPYFGGEVALGSGSVVTSPVHTGKSALSLSTGGYGFIFKSSGIQPSKTYRASVWASSSAGRIYYKLNGGAEVVATQSISQAVTLPGGTWYRINLNIPIGAVASPSIEVGVKSTSGTVVFDDFRFQPLESSMGCMVYNPETFEVEYTFDNDHLYTRYQYDDRGIVVKTYKESITHNGEKLVSEVKNNYRRNTIDQ